MKKVFGLIFILALLIAVPYSNAGDLSPPQGMDIVSISIEEEACPVVVVQIPEWVCEFAFYDANAMDAATKWRIKISLTPQETDNLTLTRRFDYRQGDIPLQLGLAS